MVCALRRMDYYSCRMLAGSAHMKAQLYRNKEWVFPEYMHDDPIHPRHLILLPCQDALLREDGPLFGLLEGLGLSSAYERKVFVLFAWRSIHEGAPAAA